jgi:hypothetical protein
MCEADEITPHDEITRFEGTHLKNQCVTLMIF